MSSLVLLLIDHRPDLTLKQQPYHKTSLDRCTRLGLLTDGHDQRPRLHPSRLRSSLTTDDVEVFLKWHLATDRSADMMTKFFERMKALPFKAFSAIKRQSNAEYLAGCERRLRGAAETPPVLSCTATELRAKVEDVASLFSLSFEDGADDHALSYNVERMFPNVFAAQEKRMSFPPIFSSEDGHDDGNTFLFQSHWIFLVTLRPSPSQGQVEECLRLLSLHKREGKGTDAILAAEMDFIAEGSIDHVEARLQEMASRRRSKYLTSINKEAPSTSSSDLGHGHGDSHTRATSTRPTASDAPEEHMLRCMLRLRLLRARSARRRLLGNLNYFRSVQRRFALDLSGLSYDVNPKRAEAGSAGAALAATSTGAQTEVEGGDRSYLQLANASAPASPNPRRVHWVSRQTKMHKRILSALTGPERRNHFGDDKNAHGAGVRVCDGTKTSIMYDATLVDLRSLEDEMLRIASQFVEDFENAACGKAAAYSEEGIEATAPTADRFTVLCDLYESESWYQDAKRKVVEKLVAVYESTFRPKEQKRIAQDVTDYMGRRPIFDIGSGAEFGSAKYFSESYAAEIVAMDMESKLLESMIKHQSAIDKTHAEHNPTNASMLAACGLHPSIYFVSGLRPMLDTLEKRLGVGNAIRDNASRRILLQELHVEWRLLLEEQSTGNWLSASEEAVNESFGTPFPVEVKHLFTSAKLVASQLEKEKCFKVGSVGGERKSEEDVRKQQIEKEEARVFQQALSALELVILRTESKDLLYECGALGAAYAAQAKECDIDIEGSHAVNEGSVAGGEKISFAERSNADGSAIAIAHIDPEFSKYDFASIAGLAKALEPQKLSQLRQLAKFQCLEQHLLVTALEFNECMLSQHAAFVEEVEFSSKIVEIWRDLAKEKGSVQALVISERGMEFSDIENFKRSRSKAARVRMEADVTFTRKQFLNYKKLQGKLRAQTLSRLSLQTSQIYQAAKASGASRGSLHVQRELSELKRELLSIYCTSLVARVESFSLCPALCSRADAINGFVKHYELTEDETCQIVYRPEVDPFKHDGKVARFFADLLVKTGWKVPYREPSSHVKGMMVLRDGTIDNVWMVPLRTEILTLCSGSSDEDSGRDVEGQAVSAKHKRARSMYGVLVPLAAALDLLELRALCTTAPANTSLSEDANRATFIAHELLKLENEIDAVARASEETYGERTGEDGVTLRAEQARTIDIVRFLAGKREELFAHTVASFQRACSPVLARALDACAREEAASGMAVAGHEMSTNAFADGMESAVFLIRSALREAMSPSQGILAGRLKWYDGAAIESMHLSTGSKASGGHRGRGKRGKATAATASEDHVDAIIEGLGSARGAEGGQRPCNLLLGPYEGARWVSGPGGLSQSAFSQMLRMCLLRVAPHVVHEISACYSRIDLEMEASDALEVIAGGAVSSGNVLQPLATSRHHLHLLHCELERQVLQGFVLEQWRLKFGMESLTARPETIREYASAKHEYNERLAWKFKGNYGQDAERVVETVAQTLEARSKERTLLRQEVYTHLQESDIFRLKALYRAVLEASSSATFTVGGSRGVAVNAAAGAVPARLDQRLGQRAKRLAVVDEFASNVISCSHEFRSVDGHKMELLRKDFARFVSELKREMLAWSDVVLGSRIQGLVARVCDLVLQNKKLRGVNLGLQRELEKERLALDRRVSLGVTDNVYQMSHNVDVLSRRIEKYETELREQQSHLRKEIHGEYGEQTKSLELELIRVRARFGEYKEALQNKMRAEILEVRKEAMLKLVEKGSAPMDAKRALLKVARDGDEQTELLDLNTSLKKSILQLEAVFKARELESKEQMEGERKRLETVGFWASTWLLVHLLLTHYIMPLSLNLTFQELNKSSAMWERVSAIERKGKAAVEELVGTKARLGEAEEELKTMRREYELAVGSKQSLVSWKVAKSREIESLQRALRKYKRWEQVDVEAIQQELAKAKEELSKLKDVEHKAGRRAKAIEDRAERRLEWMRKR